jgi:hypothetical protein
MTRDDAATVWMRRIARVWSLIVIGFTLFMAVAHIVSPEPEMAVDYPPIENLLPVIMVLSVAGLAIAWRWEGIGGAINVGFFVVHLGLYWIIRGRFLPLMAFPMFAAVVIPGVLFLICWWRMRSSQPVNIA